MDNLNLIDAVDVPELLGKIESCLLQDVDQALMLSSALQQRCKHLSLEPELKVHVYLNHAKVLWSSGNLRPALRLINRTIQLSNQLPLNHFRAEIYLTRGKINYNLKRYSAAIDDFALAADVAVDLLSVDVAIEAYLYIGSIYIVFGRHDQSYEVLNFGYKMAHAINSAKLISKSAIFLSGYLLDQHRYQDALRIMYQSEPSLLEYGDMTWLIECGKTMAVCYQHLGREEDADLYFNCMLAIAKGLNVKWAGALVAINYARFLLLKTQSAQAIEMLDSAEENLADFDDVYLAQQSAEYRVSAYKQQKDYQNALHGLKKLETIKLRWIQLNASIREVNRYGRFNDLQKVITLVDKTRQEFERLLGLIISRSSIGRESVLLEKCKNLPAAETIFLMKIDAQLMYRRLVENKVDSVFRELCMDGDLWVRTITGEYLVYFADSPREHAALLTGTITDFPWSWHECENPKIEAHWLTPAEALLKLQARVA
ncbi:hypothetical protein ABHF33_11280 [Chitinibacter sp. FCG-7]|uniref:Tetratricopeptide repeat protein n=1 Tax=Chitinibacter mangrovi TaxID=3153927 RepID=A0AAU7F6L1_9NEIS